MGVKLLVFNDYDPAVAITMEWTPEGTPGRAHGWRGACTECGKAVHYWTEAKAMENGQEHVNGHRP
jgi:hypothetical protein